MKSHLENEHWIAAVMGQRTPEPCVSGDESHEVRDELGESGQETRGVREES